MEEKKLLDKDGNEITRERIEEIMKEQFKDGPSITKEGEWYKIDTGKSSKGNRRIMIHCRQPGMDMINEAIKKDIMENYGTEEKPTTEE